MSASAREEAPTDEKRPPRRRRKAARPGEIVAAGLEHFAEHGYANTRLEDVARRAGIAKSTVYLYFANKEALFRATVEAHVGSTFEGMGAEVDAWEGDTGALLGAVLAKAYEGLVQSDNLALLRIIIAEGERFPELRRAFYEAEMTAGRCIIEAILARGVARGEFADGPAVEFPRLVAAPVITAAVWRMTFESLEPIDMPRWIEAHVALLMEGLRAR